MNEKTKRYIASWVITGCIAITWVCGLYAGAKIASTRRELENAYFTIQQLLDGTIKVSEEGTTVILK